MEDWAHPSCFVYVVHAKPRIDKLGLMLILTSWSDTFYANNITTQKKFWLSEVGPSIL